MSKRVLDIGNCGFDHGSIAQLLAKEFGAQCDAAHDAEDGLAAAQTGRYHLVLVNRVLDSGGSGLELIHTLKSDPTTRHLPVMMITNYPDHEASAIAAGAEPGFGKRSLHDPATRARLAKFLSGALDSGPILNA